MQTYTLLAPGKINLYLEIIGDRPDGFHELAMILQSIGLCDRLTVRAIDVEQIRVRCRHPGVPNDQSNLVYRAAALMAEQFPDVYNRFGGVEIQLEKKIPVGAGLAGGSTDAAAVLVGLDLMWNLGLTQADLQDLGAQLGSDVPFCVAGGTAIATGRGEVLAPLPSLNTLYLVLAKYRSLSISTAWAYKTYRQSFGETYVSGEADVSGRRQRIHSGALVSAITAQDIAKVGQLLHNDLEKVALPEYGAIAELKAAFAAAKPLGVMMSGSGPTVFAIAETAEQAEQIAATVRATLSTPDLEIWTTQSVAHGIQVVQGS
jgi:4-diphosphocytidyl-2-C-methyl-D-erythritol kinase